MKSGIAKIRKIVFLGHIGLVLGIWGGMKLSEWFAVDEHEEITPVTVLTSAPDTGGSGGEDETSDNAEEPLTESGQAAESDKPPAAEEREPEKSDAESVNVPEEHAESSSEPTEKAPDKPAWKARSAEEIRREAKLDPSPADSRNESESSPPRPRIDAARFSRKMEEDLRSIQEQQSGSRGSDSSDGQEADDVYGTAITRHLQQRWQQPSRHTVPDSVSAPTVRLVIQEDGTVTDASIIRGSGNSRLDNSVRRLLSRLDKLPPPSRYGMSSLELTVNFKLE